VSILRLQSLVAISNSEDQTYDNAPAAIWSSIEINVGIICSCLPCLRLIAARFLPAVFSSNNAANSAQQCTHSIYRRQSEPGTMLGPVGTKYAHSSDNSRNRGRTIEVVTEMQVEVEDMHSWEQGTDYTANTPPVGRGYSTETLVTDPVLTRQRHVVWGGLDYAITRAIIFSYVKKLGVSGLSQRSIGQFCMLVSNFLWFLWPTRVYVKIDTHNSIRKPHERGSRDLFGTQT